MKIDWKRPIGQESEGSIGNSIHPLDVHDPPHICDIQPQVQCLLNASAKYYCLSVELNDGVAQNSFLIYLERGIGVQSKIALAAHYYQ
jgi:hypothetical protein